MGGKSAGIGVLVAVFFVALVQRTEAQSRARKPNAQERGRLARILRGEFPDDPPGIVNRRTPPKLVPPFTVPWTPFEVVQVNVDSMGQNITGDAANEPSIAVDRTNPTFMAIGWRQFDTIDSNFRQAGWGYTQNGGQSWTFPGVINPGVFRSDPVLTSDSQGNFYYNSLSTPGGNFQCDVFRSTNGGMSWGPASFAFGGDKAWMTIDRTGGIGDGNIYQAWNVFGGCCGSDTFNRSTDGGTSFETPIAIPLIPIFGTLDVGTDGALYIAGVDPDDFSNFLLAKSSNAQNRAVTPTFDFTVAVDMGGEMALGGGPNPAGLLGQANVAVNPSNGHVYFLCSVDPPGADPLDIHFARSTDGGMTWSDPVRVNDDPSGTNAWQWFGTMSVAPNGRIDAVWNDTRAMGMENLSQTVYARSTDGGETWSPNRAFTQVWDSHVGFPNQDKIGDYYDMVSDNAGADLAFSTTMNGEQDVYYVRITP